jgi:NAD(P)-dependent dehydrogenase (short-subunit alcohol dehydrogenase family)
MFKNNLYNYLLSASANSAPALNFATFLAAIWIFSLVAGLIPSRAGRSFTLKVPKPTNWIFDKIQLEGPAVFLASEASNAVNGHILYVDGGILAYIGKQPK